MQHGKKKIYKKQKPQKKHTVLFFGATSSGKSTLLNAICKKQILPENPMTSSVLPTRLRGGHGQSRYFAWRKGKRTPEQYKHKEFLSKFCYNDLHQGGSDKSRFSEYILLDVSLSSPLLNRGVIFYDTPGIGAKEIDDFCTKTFAENMEADLIFFVTRHSNLWKEEVTFIREYLWPLLREEESGKIQYEKFYLAANESMNVPSVLSGLQNSMGLLFDEEWIRENEKIYLEYQKTHLLRVNAQTARLNRVGYYPYQKLSPKNCSSFYLEDAKRMEKAERKVLAVLREEEDGNIGDILQILENKL